MTLSLKYIICGTLMTLILHTNAQQQLAKIKSKNFIGEWESNDTISSVSRNPIVSFEKRNTELNSITEKATVMKFYKNESAKVIRKNSFVPNNDTLGATWLFVDNSKNLKIIEKIIAKSYAVVFKDANGNQTNFDFFITKITTFHVEFISDNKLVLKYVNTLNK